MHQLTDERMRIMVLALVQASKNHILQEASSLNSLHTCTCGGRLGAVATPDLCIDVLVMDTGLAVLSSEELRRHCS